VRFNAGHVVFLVLILAAVWCLLEYFQIGGGSSGRGGGTGRRGGDKK
jgi:hypothetical protein